MECALCRLPIKPGEAFDRYEVPGRFDYPGEVCHVKCFDRLEARGRS